MEGKIIKAGNVVQGTILILLKVPQEEFLKEFDIQGEKRFVFETDGPVGAWASIPQAKERKVILLSKPMKRRAKDKPRRLLRFVGENEKKEMK